MSEDCYDLRLVHLNDWPDVAPWELFECPAFTRPKILKKDDTGRLDGESWDQWRKWAIQAPGQDVGVTAHGVQLALTIDKRDLMIAARSCGDCRVHISSTW